MSNWCTVTPSGALGLSFMGREFVNLGTFGSNFSFNAGGASLAVGEFAEGFAVKGATKHMILASFEERVGNAPEQEFAMAISQVCRIFRFRIEDRVSP